MNIRPVFLRTLADTENFAERMAASVRRGDVIGLVGDLGSGKSTFARAFIRHFGVAGEIPSPTFTLLQTYTTPDFPIHHFDLYRIKAEAELDELGFEELLGDGVMLIEWPQIARRRLPARGIILHFEIVDGAHKVTQSTLTEWVANHG